MIFQYRWMFAFFLFSSLCLCMCVCETTVCWLPQWPKRQPHCIIADKGNVKKRAVFLPLTHPSIHPLISVHLLFKKEPHWNLHKTISLVCAVYLCICVCILYVSALPWLQARLTGVITSEPPLQWAKSDRKGLKAAPPLFNTCTHMHTNRHRSWVLV